MVRGESSGGGGCGEGGRQSPAAGGQPVRSEGGLGTPSPRPINGPVLFWVCVLTVLTGSGTWQGRR